MLVAQSCLTLYEPMDCSLPASSIQGVLQAKILEWVAFFLQGIFLTQGLNPGLLDCRQILYCLSHQGTVGICSHLCRRTWTVVFRMATKAILMSQ